MAVFGVRMRAADSGSASACAEIRLQPLSCLPACQYDWMRYRLLPIGCARLRRQGCSIVGHDSPTARDLLSSSSSPPSYTRRLPAITDSLATVSMSHCRAACLIAKRLQGADYRTNNIAHTIWSLLSRSFLLHSYSSRPLHDTHSEG